MVRKVCLDSDVMIEILKNNKETITAVSSLPAFLYTTSINVFELWGGRKKSETIINFLEWYNLLDFDKNSALI